MIHRLAIALVIVVLTGCISIGRSAERYPPARSAAGVQITLETRARTVVGELLEVRDDAYLVREDRLIVLVPRAAVLRSRMEGSGERLRLLSRFPQGLSPELMRALLDAYDQPELEVVRP